MSNNKILVIVDESNFIYYTLFGAFSTWKKFSPNYNLLSPAEETDQDNLPNLLVYDDYRKTLHEQVQKRLGTLDWIVKENHQSEVDDCVGIDFVFSRDDNIMNNFRKRKYPEYKAQRKFTKRQYDVGKVRQYVKDVVFKELDLEKRYGYRFISVEGCESDDVIACILRNFTDYECRILISSDKDFLQIPDVNQYDMSGKRIERVVCGETLSPEDFLLWKEINGDNSDNIPGVFKGVGEKKSLGLVHNREALAEKLMESQAAAERMKLNMEIIDFNNIPKDLENKVITEFSSTGGATGVSNRTDLESTLKDFDDFMSKINNDIGRL